MFNKIHQGVVNLPDNIIPKIYEIKNTSKHVPLRSNIKGWQSKQFKNFEEVPWIKEVSMQCFTLFNLNDCSIASFWFNINPHGAHHHWHVHGGEAPVLVCYLQVPKNSGNIEFIHNDETTAIEPEAGTAITFPANLKHRVLPNLTNTDRITLAFNLRSKA